MNKANLTRLSKYIKEIGGKETSKSRAGSHYYKLGNLMIRVSDHLPGIKSRDQICIILPYNGSGYSVFINKVLFFNFQTLKEVKLLLSLYVIFTLGNNAKEERINKVSGDSSNNKKETINSLQSQLNTLKQKYGTLIKLNQKSLEKITSQRREINNLLHHVKL